MLVLPSNREVLKVARSRFLQRQNRHVDTRARALSAALESWLRRYALRAMVEARRVLGSPRAMAALTRKRVTPVSYEALEQELYLLLRKYGLVQLNAAGQFAAGSVGAKWILRPEIKLRVEEQIASNVQLLMEQTADQMKESLRRLITDAYAEETMPSSRDLTRRIARQWFGPGVEAVGDISAGTLGELRAIEQEHLFSFERAERIARTELAMTENEGIAEGFAESGVETVGWLAHGDDGRSGEREHWRMNDHPPISIAAMRGADHSQWFELPDGTRMPYPGWRGAPVKHLANCRCTLVAAG